MKTKASHSLRLSIIEIARKAGVSSATVSRAFNRPELLKSSTLARVEKIAREQGFRPNRIGRSLRQGSTRTIGLLLPTLNNPVFAECFEGACRYAQRAGYSVMVATTNYFLRDELACLQTLIDHQVDGLIMTLGAPITEEAHELLQESELPYILAYSFMPGVPSVCIDDDQAGQDLLALLAAFGHRRIAFASGPLCNSDRALRRLHGARTAAQRHALDDIEHLAMLEHTTCDPAALEQLLRHPQPASAVICSNDLLALSLISQCRQLGLEIPRDLSVCGFDGIAVGAMADPPLTTVTQPSHEIGRTACQALLEHLRDHTDMRSTLVPHRIFEGGTVRLLTALSS